ncbi:MAG: ATP-grasp domain-containing protein [Desulfovibrionaceae bacterium]
MLLDEHHSKDLLSEFGVPVPKGMALWPGDLTSAQPPFSTPWFVKAQVLTGGRGKAGGIRRVDTLADLPGVARQVLDLPIRGHRAPYLRLEPGANIEREFYLSFAVSRSRRSVVLTAGREGGMEIEGLGAENLLTLDVPLPDGPRPHQLREALFHLGLPKALAGEFQGLLEALWRAVTEAQLLLAEINPLVLTTDGRLLALDAKVEVDDNALDLNPDLGRFLEPAHFPDEENIARAAGLSYVDLNGFVGIMVNGAGLAMATMDLLNFSDLPAANFLDLGGGADAARMRTAFQLLFAHPRVRLIFLNLFGGILSCEKVALAMREALDGKAPRKPIVARLSGNSAEAGRAVLTGLRQPDIHLARSMAEAVEILHGLKPADAPASPFTLPAERPATPRPPAALCAGPGCALARELNLDDPRGPAVLVQGVTGKEGRHHAGLMRACGANVVAGVTPFKGGQEMDGVPVYDTVRQACAGRRVDVSIIFVPPRLAPDAILEAAEAGVRWIVCITEGIRQQDMLAVLPRVRELGARLVGPNTPGLMVPGRFKIGILPPAPFTPGPLAVLSRSGTLTYECAARLSAAGLGQSFCLGIGGDPFIGLGFVEAFELLRDHAPTRAVVVLGEIGGRAEEDLARFVTETRYPKPVVAFVAGRTAPPGRRLGHAGAILEPGASMEGKLDALRGAGFLTASSLTELPALAARALDL